MTTGQDEVEPVNILLVDDRPANLRALEAILRRPDYNLVAMHSGEEALGCVLRQEFAVILLDVAMPDMDGFETATIIKNREQSKLIPIIFITASVFDMEHIFRGYTVGAVDYLRKPIDPHEVRAKVAVFVELFRQRKQIERQARRLYEVELREQRLLREHAEAAQRESEALYEYTFEQAPVGIGHASPDGRWIQANARLREILGCSREDLLGRGVKEIANDEDARALAGALSRLEEGSASSYAREHRLASEREGEIWGFVTISALRDSAGRVTSLIVVVDDTTARKEAEIERARLIHRLERSIRVRDEFLAITAHELKTPITPLRLHTASLLREGEKQIEKQGPSSERLLRRLRKIDLAAARVERLIDRLLDLSVLSVGDLVLHREDVDLKAVVEDVVARIAEESHHESEISIHAPESVVGRWDRLRLEQVVTNLLSNAIKYGKGEPIEVSVQPTGHGDRVRLAVKDRGIGIPPAEQERLFERFERLTPLRYWGGFGIGLWIVRELVEAHGGHVTVSSKPGEGSEFAVELPCRALREQAEDAPRATSLPSEVHP